MYEDCVIIGTINVKNKGALTLKYIESVKNPKVKAWKKLLTKKEREQTGKYLIEGFHLVEEALKEANCH